MNVSLSLAEKVIAAAGIGLLIGLEREWAHKEAGARSFALTALLGMVSWLVAPSFAFVEVGVVVVILLLVNLFSLREHQPLEITTSLALAVTNVLGILVGMGMYFLAFTCALLVTTLLSWKPEFAAFISKLTASEIRGALLLGFVTAVMYPLLPAGFVDPWQLLNPRGIWLAVMIVSGLSFANYLLLRQLGAKGVRYSALLGGLVNSAAMSALLGEELKQDPGLSLTATSNLLLADLAMILRDSILVAMFSWSVGIQKSVAPLIVLGTMMLTILTVTLLVVRRSEKQASGAFQRLPLRSPLSLRSMLAFGTLFFSLTLISGLGQKFFGTAGFTTVVIIGALASAASSAVLVGSHISLIGASTAAFAMLLATIVGLAENVVIFFLVTRNRMICLHLMWCLLPVVLLGILALLLVLLQGGSISI